VTKGEGGQKGENTVRETVCGEKRVILTFFSNFSMNFGSTRAKNAGDLGPAKGIT